MKISLKNTGRFEFRVSRNPFLRLLSCFVFFNRGEPNIGDKIYFIVGNEDTYLTWATVVTKGGNKRRHIYDDFAFINTERRNQRGSLVSAHSVGLHRIVKNTIITRAFVWAANFKLIDSVKTFKNKLKKSDML